MWFMSWDSNERHSSEKLHVRSRQRTCLARRDRTQRTGGKMKIKKNGGQDLSEISLRDYFAATVGGGTL